MELNEVVAKLAAKRGGQFTTITLDRIVKVGKREVRKVSRYQVLAHALYVNCAPVREAIEQGLRGKPETPDWAEVFEVEGVRLWKHKVNGTMYLPVPTIGTNRKSDYFDPTTGEAIDRSTLSLPKSEPTIFTSCKIINIVSIV